MMRQVPAPSEVREVFERVLAEPEFRVAGTSPIVRWLQALAEAVQDFLLRLLPTLGETQIRILSWLLIVATVALTIHAVVRRFGGEGTRRPSGSAPPTFAGGRPRSAADWVVWARDAAGAGRLRDAATGIYQATILHLDGAGALRYREWKTPGDYAMEVSAQDALRAPFMDFLGRFLEVAFGPAEPTREAFDKLSARATRIGSPL
jgi:hypothetical protein